MSHIPASAMPHAKPHEDAPPETPHRDSAGHETPAVPDEVAARVPATEFRASDAPGSTSAAAATPAAPPVHDAPPGVPPAGPGKRPGPGGGAGFYLTIAAVTAVAVGGVVAALAARRPEPPKQDGKRKGKPGRKPKAA